MKLFLIAVVVSFISVQILAEEITEEKRLETRKKCQEESGVTNLYLNAALKGNVRDNYDLKKFFLCFFEELGVLGGYTLNRGKLKEYIEVALPDKKDQAQQITDECADKKMDKPLETAFQVAKCVLEKKKE